MLVIISITKLQKLTNKYKKNKIFLFVLFYKSLTIFSFKLSKDHDIPNDIIKNKQKSKSFD